MKSGLFYDDSAMHLASAVSNEVSEEAKLCHLRLGHVPFSQVKHIFPSINVKDICNRFICQICPKIRQSRNPFHLNSIKTTRPFQLLHDDVSGAKQALYIQ